MKTQGNFFGDAAKIHEMDLPQCTLSVYHFPLLLCFMTAKPLSLVLFFCN